MILYNLVLFFGFILFLPKIVLKKSPTLRQRFGLDLPFAQLKSAHTIWIHAVSVGEVKSVQKLVQKLRIAYPQQPILITTCTATGLEEAKRSLPQADAYYFLPLDFRWIMRKWVRALKPSLLIFVETDLWYNLLKEAKAIGAKTVLVSGKISDRSAKRYAKVPFFAHRLFALLDLALVQTEDYYQRLKPWVSNLQIGGNLKFDAEPVAVDKKKWAPYFKGQNILITCTHAPEEADLLDALQSVEGVIYLAPRHPERFEAVAALLNAKGISFVRWSQIEQQKGNERVVLIDGMGLLPIFYTHCQIAIVAGSFSSLIGGHNILEPCLYGTPVFFGPIMHEQTELVARILKAGAGCQTTLTTLAADIQTHRANPRPMELGAQQVVLASRGVVEGTFAKITQLK